MRSSVARTSEKESPSFSWRERQLNRLKEKDVWKRYLVLPRRPMDLDYRYEVTVGSKRIDVVGENKNKVELFEIKRRADRVALGQILEYGSLYRKEVNPPKPIYLNVVAESSDKDIPWKKYSVRKFSV